MRRTPTPSLLSMKWAAFGLAAVVWGVLPAPASAADLHVSPSGDDAGGDGSSGKPFATPARAVQALRGRKAGDGARILLHAGTYPVQGGLRFGEGESGTAQAPVVVRAAGDGPVALSGAVRIPAAAVREVSDAETLARLPAQRDPGTKLFEIRLTDLRLDAFPELLPHGHSSGKSPAWPQLLRSDAYLPLAAWPDGEGYADGFKPLKILSAGIQAKAAADYKADRSPMVFTVDPAKAAQWKTALEKHRASLWLGGHWFWDWSDDRLPVAGIDDQGAVTMGRPHAYGIGMRHASLHAYNLAEEMDRAGEYALEPAAKRILVLLDPADAGKLSLTWAAAPALAVAKGAHLRFEGLRLEDLRGDAAVVQDGTDIVFDRCAFVRVGRSGAEVAGGQGVVFRDCTFSHLGAGGVELSGGDRKTLTPSGHLAERCLFEDFGRLRRTYAPGVSLQGVGATVRRCVFRDAPHAAILFGGNEHRIQENEITRALRETGDCGAIYGGRDWTSHGTVIENNWIHDLGGVPGRWACGIYLDDMLSGITVRNNWVDRTELGMMVGGGRFNQISGNILSRCKQGISADARGTTWAPERLMPTLKQRLAAVPVDQEPWKSRYPMLARTLKDSPEKPVGTRITGNAMVACQKPWLNRADAGVAVLAPNFENLPESALEASGDGVKVKETPLRFRKPMVPGQ